jgi:flagellar transcriptional activator FlhC
MLTTVPCSECGGHFIMHAMDLQKNYVCGMCHVPSRAGKTRKAAAELQLQQQQPAAAPPALRGAGSAKRSRQIA